MAHTYHIHTDDFSISIEAENVADALSQAGVPESVTDADAFAEWLESAGGYGAIHEDGVELVRVQA